MAGIDTASDDEEDEGRDIENDEDRPNDGTEDGNLNSDRLNTGSVGVGGGSEGGIGDEDDELRKPYVVVAP
jgi:hypothetical protein